MTVTLELKPEIERGLLTQAQKRGASLNAYLQEELSKLASIGVSASPVRELIGQEWVKHFDEWADSFPDAPPISGRSVKPRMSLWAGCAMIGMWKFPLS